MDWFTGDLDWLAIGIAFLITFIFGWIWYSPFGFFPLWQRLGRFTDEDMKQRFRPVDAFGGTLVGNIVGVIVLGMLVPAVGADSAWSGAFLGLVMGVAFRGGAHVLHNGFALRDSRITLIDTAHDTIAIGIAGLIIGAMA